MSKEGAIVHDATTGRFTIGFKGISKLNAVDGIELSVDSQEMFAEFERRNVSPEERRRAIIAKHVESSSRWARIYQALAK